MVFDELQKPISSNHGMNDKIWNYESLTLEIVTKMPLFVSHIFSPFDWDKIKQSYAQTKARNRNYCTVIFSNWKINIFKAINKV